MPVLAQYGHLVPRIIGGIKPKTPMLAGSIIGSIMGAAYVIGFTIYFRKRWRRRQREKRAAAGEVLEPRAKDILKPDGEKIIIIPPDPAVLNGQRLPGERVLGHESSDPHHLEKTHTLPIPLVIQPMHDGPEVKIPAPEPVHHSDSAPSSLPQLKAPNAPSKLAAP